MSNSWGGRRVGRAYEGIRFSRVAPQRRLCQKNTIRNKGEAMKTMSEILYVDPPWKQTKGGIRKCRPQQGNNLDYKTLTVNDIKSMIGKYDSKVMFLWTIDKFLFVAEELAIALGYRLHARLIWDKTNGVAPAFTVRYSHEYLLWCYKSPMLKISESTRGKYTTVMREKSLRHSQKPECAYEMIEALYPCAKKVELFARTRRIGWEQYGDQLENEAGHEQ